MGLSYTGINCLETACVTWVKTGTEPPAKIMPLRVFIVRDFATPCWYIKPYALMLESYVF